MEPVNVGRNLYVSTSVYKEQDLFHIRKYYKKLPSTYGVAFNAQEFEALLQSEIAINDIIKSGSGGTIQLCKTVSVTMTKKWITFTKGADENKKSISLLKDEWISVCSQLPATRRWMSDESRKTASKAILQDEDHDTNDDAPFCPMCFHNPKLHGGVCQICGYAAMDWANEIYNRLQDQADDEHFSYYNCY